MEDRDSSPIEDNSLEDLLLRHKEEKKALQNNIIALKKTVPKNDKKKRKQIQDDISKWEKDIEERHSLEVTQFNMTKISLNINENELNANDKYDPIKNGEIHTAPQIQRISKAQKRREKKEAAEKERSKAIADQEDDILKGARHLEMVAIQDVLKKRNLSLYNIPSDGDCLYGAVSHQLNTVKNKLLTVKGLRMLTAKYLRENMDFFSPFLCDPETGDMMTCESFNQYCNKIELTSAWGGQIELQALCKSLQTPIHILQATTPHVIVQGDEFNGDPLILTYHRHMYSLGEHYNSTIQGRVDEETED